MNQIVDIITNTTEIAMALSDEFERAWRGRFPTDVPPDLPLDTYDLQAINKALLDCKAKISEYQKKLHQQEFVHEYLQDMLHKKKTNIRDDMSSDSVFRKESLERKGSGNSKGFAYTIKPAITPFGPVPQPVEVLADTKVDLSKKPSNSESFRAKQQLLLQSSINKSLSEQDKEKIAAASKSSDDLSQPSRGNYVNLDYSDVSDSRPLERTGSDGSLSARSSKKQSKPVPAPRPSIHGPSMGKDQAGAIAGEFQERLSMKRAQSPVNLDKGEEKVRNKFNMPRRNHLYESVHLPEVKPLNNGQQQQQPQQQLSHQAASSSQPSSTYITFKPRTMSVESSDSVGGMLSFKPLPSAKEVEVPDPPPPLFKRCNSSNGGLGDPGSSSCGHLKDALPSKPPKLSSRTDSLDSYPESPRLPKKPHKRQEHIYDEPVPVGGQDPESDSSSDEEEPIYFNILLLKQKTMQKNKSMYASVDIQKKQVENQARRLSKKFTQSLDLSGNARQFPPPVMKPIRETAVIKGVTTSGNIIFSLAYLFVLEQCFAE